MLKETAEGKLKNKMFYTTDHVKALETVVELYEKLGRAEAELAELRKALDWCFKNEATIYFHPSNPATNSGELTFGKVQVLVKSQGSGGDTLSAAVEQWTKAYASRKE